MQRDAEGRKAPGSQRVLSLWCRTWWLWPGAEVTTEGSTEGRHCPGKGGLQQLASLRFLLFDLFVCNSIFLFILIIVQMWRTTCTVYKNSIFAQWFSQERSDFVQNSELDTSFCFSKLRWCLDWLVVQPDGYVEGKEVECVSKVVEILSESLHVHVVAVVSLARVTLHVYRYPMLLSRDFEHGKLNKISEVDLEWWPFPIHRLQEWGPKHPVCEERFWKGE